MIFNKKEYFRHYYVLHRETILEKRRAWRKKNWPRIYKAYREKYQKIGRREALKKKLAKKLICRYCHKPLVKLDRREFYCNEECRHAYYKFIKLLKRNLISLK